MSENTRANWSDDTRSISELIRVWLTEENDDAAWEAVHVLRLRGTREVFEAARELSASKCIEERELGVYVLGQLGAPELPFLEESTNILLGMLREEKDPSVLRAIGISIGDLHPQDSQVVEALVRLKEHPESAVRQAVAYGLAGYQDDSAVNAVIELSADQDSDVRDWAVHFGLDSLSGPDTPAIRDALLRRLSDEDEEIRNEALLGLAHRRDEKVIGPLLDELRKMVSQGGGYNYVFEAIKEMPDPRFCPLLIDLKQSIPDDPWLDEAIDACKCLD